MSFIIHTCFKSLYYGFHNGMVDFRDLQKILIEWVETAPNERDIANWKIFDEDVVKHIPLFKNLWSRHPEVTRPDWTDDELDAFDWFTSRFWVGGFAFLLRGVLDALDEYRFARGLSREPPNLEDGKSKFVDASTLAENLENLRAVMSSDLVWRLLHISSLEPLLNHFDESLLSSNEMGPTKHHVVCHCKDIWTMRP